MTYINLVYNYEFVMNEKNLVRNLIIVIFILVIIYSLLRVGAGLDLSLGPYIK